MKLHTRLRKLETELLGEDARRNPLVLERLLAADFLEFSASGTVWRKQATIEALKAEVFVERSISDFALNPISEDAALLTYTCTSPRSKSLRSSIWRRNAEGWQLYFHQGTPMQAVA